ncbi:MAG: hypothetical protein DMG16_18305 [Acidobacteria bacterium]|nr:MAG: hypothetical protein DMG16_18305 [Acidobacteriota bacterium]
MLLNKFARTSIRRDRRSFSFDQRAPNPADDRHSGNDECRILPYTEHSTVTTVGRANDIHQVRLDGCRKRRMFFNLE